MSKDNTLIRLKKVLLSDKINMPNGLMRLVKKDVMSLLKNYFEFDDNNLVINVISNKEGLYDISIHSTAEKIKTPKFM